MTIMFILLFLLVVCVIAWAVFHVRSLMMPKPLQGFDWLEKATKMQAERFKEKGKEDDEC